MGSYQNFMPGLLDYATYFKITETLTQTGQMVALHDHLFDLSNHLVDVTLLGRFLENHDTERFARRTTDAKLRQSAFVFNILGDGIPIVSRTGNYC